MRSSASRIASSTPTSVADRAQNPVGSGSRAIDGTIVSHSSRSVWRCTSVKASGMPGRSLSLRSTGCREYRSRLPSARFGDRTGAMTNAHAVAAGGSVPIVAPKGALDLGTSRDLQCRLAELAGETAQEAILDLSGVSFIDSIGLGVVLKAASRFHRQAKRLFIV